MKNRNLTMLADFYELTMANGYIENNMQDKIVYFDLFYRSVPENGGFAIAAGLEQAIEYLSNLKFSGEDISYLESKGIFSAEFLEYLKNFKFSCDVWAVPEGTPIFPNEPIVIVRGPALEAQFIETMLLICINHQSLIATKSSRIVRAANGRPVMEFGSRRAQGFDGAIYGARAAYIAGCSGTACALSDKDLSVPALGTMAHSWIQMFDKEIDAFRAYAKCYPENTVLLVDTYDVLKSGVPNAITVFKEMVSRGEKPVGIRIDSGDITYLSQKARQMFDAEGLYDVKIVASNSLDEYIIRDILLQGAKIDSFGVGERLITSKAESVFGGVYKLSAVENDGEILPKIKISENVSKITVPHFKNVWRLYDNVSKKAIADVLTVYDENIDDSIPYEIFDPEHTYRRKTLTNFTAKKLLVPIFESGELVYNKPSIGEIRNYCKVQLDSLWDELKRFENPHKYYVDLSQKLWEIKQSLLVKNKK